MNDEFQIVCPTCKRSIGIDPPNCHNCDFEGKVLNGIPSFTSSSQTGEYKNLGSEEIGLLADQAEVRSIREVTMDLFRDHEYSEKLLSDIYDIKRDSWRVFFAEHLFGRCLDLNAGFGRRAHLLSDIVNEVYAVDTSLNKLRVLSARDDYQNENIRPIHANLENLPFPTNAFDIIVADFTDRIESANKIECLFHYLKPSGTLVILFNGPMKYLGISNKLGFSQSDYQLNKLHRASRTRTITSDYERKMRAMGFTTINLLALLPTSDKVDIVLNTDDEESLRHLRRSIFTGDTKLSYIADKAFRLATDTRLVKQIFPSYCMVGWNRKKSTGDFCPDLKHPYLVTGRSRSIVLELSNGSLESVLKIPNCNRHILINQREHQIINNLKSTEEPITETLPSGSIIQTKFGPVRQEQPVQGESLTKKHSSYNEESFQEVLEIGFNWLIKFQKTFKSDTIIRSPSDIRSDLSFSPLGIESKEVHEPMEMFRTPVHGDFLPGNIYEHNGEVTAVIDWEYSTMNGWPVIDAGMLLINTAKRAFGGVEQGIANVFYKENEYRDIVNEVIRDYCAKVNLPYKSFLHYLPTVYLNRLKIDWKANSMSTYDTTVSKRLSRVRTLQGISNVSP